MYENNFVVCSKCLVSKPREEFHASKSAKNGLKSNCKACRAESGSKWRKENRESDMARKAAWAANNRAKVAAINASYRDRNPQSSANYSAAWRKRNPERSRIQLQNKRARKRDNGGKLSAGLAEKLFAMQKGKCACCGLPLGDDFHLDHIVPSALGGPNEDSNIQLLRRKCNMSKGAKPPLVFMQSKGFLL